MEQHEIWYEGLEMTIFGDWEDPDDTTGYKGGWSTDLIEVNRVDIYWLLKREIIERINEIIVEIR